MRFRGELEYRQSDVFKTCLIIYEPPTVAHDIIVNLILELNSQVLSALKLDTGSVCVCAYSVFVCCYHCHSYCGCE